MKSRKPNKRQIELKKKKARCVPVLLEEGFLRAFCEICLVTDKTEVSLSIACHSWRALEADSFALPFLVKMRGGSHPWSAQGDLVTDLFTNLSKAITREVQNLPAPSGLVEGGYFCPRRRVATENANMKKRRTGIFFRNIATVTYNQDYSSHLYWSS